MKKHIKTIIAALLSIVILVSAVYIPAAADTDGGISGKTTAPVITDAAREEVIYANLDATGKLQYAYAVTSVTADGAGLLYGYGDYDELINLTDTQPLIYNAVDHSVIMEITNPDKPFYYQGKLSSPSLPWTFDITYNLNGNAVSADKLAGACGNLGINIKTSRNPDVSSVFYENYMLQITVTLDGDRCKNIAAGGASVASSGKNKLITCTVMPESSGDCSISADVTDFVMSGISIAAVPFSSPISIPDTSEITGGLSELSSAVSLLYDGIDALSYGANELYTGTSAVSSGMTDFAAGINVLSSNGDEIISGAGKINTALLTISQQLAASEKDMSEISKLYTALTTAADALDNITSQLRSAASGYVQLSSVLSGAIAAIPDADITQDEIAALYAAAGASEAADTIAKLIKTYEAAARVRGIYDSGIGDALAGAASGIGAMADGIAATGVGLRTAANMLAEAGFADKIGGLADGIAVLSSSCGDFLSGLTQYINGVNTVADNAGTLADGVSAAADGAGELRDGVYSLRDGIGTLDKSTRDLPEKTEAGIKAITDSFDNSDFTPVSFLSPNNKSTDSVQFVIMTAGIGGDTATDSDNTGDVKTEESDDLTFWERFTALFK